MSQTPNVEGVTQGFVFALITTIWLCLKMISFWFNIWWQSQKVNQKMSQSPNVGSVTQTLRAKDLRAMKLGVPPRTLWSNHQDPVLLVWWSLFGSNFFKSALVKTSNAHRTRDYMAPLHRLSDDPKMHNNNFPIAIRMGRVKRGFCD